MSQVHISEREPLSRTNVADPVRFADGSILQLLAKLRTEDPVHYCEDSPYGSYWSIMRYDDIMGLSVNG